SSGGGATSNPAPAGGPTPTSTPGPGAARKTRGDPRALGGGNRQPGSAPPAIRPGGGGRGAPAPSRHPKSPPTPALPPRLGFSAPENVAELRRLLHGMFGDEAILFSLLGNTLANFKNDTELLRMFAGQLLRPQDRFLLEVATTQRLSDILAQEAAEEYERSRT